MAFTNSFRMERVYFERLKSMIDILKPYLNTETDEKLKSILENSIDDNGAILLLYRNLGECWAELSDLIKKADEKIDSLNDKADKYHDELNERIDEVNNYIMGILREIEARLETVEQDLSTLSRNIILDLEHVNDDYTLSYKGDPVDFAQLAEWVSFPHNVIVRGVVNGEETVFHLREFDTDETSGVFEFFATGLIDNVVHEITVTVLPDDSVNVATDIQRMKEYSAGNGIIIDSNDEISVDTDVIQEKLTAGSGISIDPDTNEITNTAQGVIYSAGQSVQISNDNKINVPLSVFRNGRFVYPPSFDLNSDSQGSRFDGGSFYKFRRVAKNPVNLINVVNAKKLNYFYMWTDLNGSPTFTLSNYSAPFSFMLEAKLCLTITFDEVQLSFTHNNKLCANVKVQSGTNLHLTDIGGDSYYGNDSILMGEVKNKALLNNIEFTNPTCVVEIWVSNISDSAININDMATIINKCIKPQIMFYADL